MPSKFSQISVKSFPKKPEVLSRPEGALPSAYWQDVMASTVKGQMKRIDVTIRHHTIIEN